LKIEEEIFSYEDCLSSCYGFSTLKESIQKREVHISVNLDHNENYINIDLENQLLILAHNIIENKDIFQIIELQVTIDEYEYIFQFYVTTMYKKEIDIILEFPWFKNLGIFILNMEKKFVTFPYKKKTMTFQNTTMRSKSIIPLSNDFKNILKVIRQENQKSTSKQKEFD
jgi:hypothetical protein